MATQATGEIRPQGRLDFVVDWAAVGAPWLANGETISSYEVSVSAPLEIAEHSRLGGVITVWVTCPADATQGAVGALSIRIVTSQGRHDRCVIDITVNRSAPFA